MSSVSEESKCGYTFLGKSGLRVSNVCLGAMTFGENNRREKGQLDEAGAHNLINRYVDWGGNFIDTADIYGRGNSERVVGSWLAGQERDRYVIATKVRHNMDPTNANAIGLSRRHITRAIEDSLAKLHTHYVDLYQTHIWDEAVPLEETLLALNDLVRCGKVRYLGASNLTGWQTSHVVDVSEKMGLNPFISLQQQYSLVCRVSEQEAFQVCKLRGLGVLPWGPLRAGFLAGKMTRGQKPTEGRLVLSAADVDHKLPSQYPDWDKLNSDRNWAIIDTLKKIAQARGKTVAQVSLRWLLQKPIVTSVIIGATKMHQLDDNMGAANGWSLAQEEMAQLDAVSAPELDSPYSDIPKSNVTRKNPWHPNGYV